MVASWSQRWDRLAPGLVLKEHLSPFTRVRFVFWHWRRAKRGGQIVSSQGKLPIVQASKQDETWNMAARNELSLCVCVCMLVSSLQSIPNFLSFSHPLELLRRHNPREAITMTTAVRICTTVISVVWKKEGIVHFRWIGMTHTSERKVQSLGWTCGCKRRKRNLPSSRKEESRRLY